jgi:hypothetical protein
MTSSKSLLSSSGLMSVKSTSSSAKRRATPTTTRRSAQVKVRASSDDVVVSIDELTETTRKAIKTYGYDDKATECILDILMYAQLRGNNQGMF